MSTNTRRSRESKPGIVKRQIFAAYLRLTVDRDGNKIGYNVQREAIERHAAKEGIEVVWFQDKDLTAADRKVVRPEYEKMLKRVAAGEFAGIIVWRLDRLVRLVREFERCFGIVEDAGAYIIDVDGGTNTRKGLGQALMRFAIMFAEMEIAGMRVRAKAYHNHMAKNGQLSTGGCRPFGFIGVERDKNGDIINRPDVGIEHHPIEAPLIRAAAERVARNGAAYNDIAREWAGLTPPIVGTRGGALPGGRVREILTSPRVAGYREYDLFDDDGQFTGTDLAKAVWKPIIPREIWEILNSRAVADSTGPRTTRSEYLFTGGVAQCGTCGRPMIGATVLDTKTETRVPAYRCNASVPARKAGSCGKPLVRADHLEHTVLEQLFARLEETPELYDQVNAEADSGEAGKRESILKEINDCNQKLRALGERVALREDDPMYLTDAEAAGQAGGFRKRLGSAQSELRQLSTETGNPTPTEEDRKDVQRWLKSLSLGERRSWLKAHIAAVLVDPVRVRRPFFDESRVRTLFADAKHGR